MGVEAVGQTDGDFQAASAVPRPASQCTKMVLKPMASSRLFAASLQRRAAGRGCEIRPLAQGSRGLSPARPGPLCSRRINARSRRRFRRAFRDEHRTPVPLVFGDYALEDRYRLDKGRVYLTGIQALVRLPMMQRQRDLAAGLNTGGFISGYRGSPLGMYDNALWTAKRYLKENNIHFQPGPQRGPGRHRGVGHAAGQPVPRRHRRWRVLDLVRQGPGRRPLDGRAEARQCRRHLAAWRRDRAGRRRPWLPVLDPAAPERAGLRRRDDPGGQPGQRPGVSRLRHAGLRAVALLGLLDRLQGDLRDRRIRRLGVGRSRAHQDRDADRLPAAARRARHPQSRPAARGREAPAWAEDGGGEGVRARQRLRQDGDRSAAARASAS